MMLGVNGVTGLEYNENEFAQKWPEIFEAFSLMEKAYMKRRPEVWVVAFSGGKDSTLLLDLTLRVVVKNIGKSTKPVHIVANDTLVESPLVTKRLYQVLERVKDFVKQNDLPVKIQITKPRIEDSFWVSLIGKGYPPPSRNFRWCTDKLKIKPTSAYIKSLQKKLGEDEVVRILLGTRSAESSTRAASLRRHNSLDHYTGQSKDCPNCITFTPIRDLVDNQVWEFLLKETPVWGGNNRDLIDLYVGALGSSECSLVIEKSELRGPSCGEKSPRFGCWVCTLVKDDKSLEGLVRFGHRELEPLVNFRRWLTLFAADIKNRMPINRKGFIRYKENGEISPGPLTLEARKMIYEKVRDLERATKTRILTQEEILLIQKHWEEDRRFYSFIGDDTINRLKDKMQNEQAYGTERGI